MSAGQAAVSLTIIAHPFRLMCSPRTWLAALFLPVSFALGIFWFSTLVTLVAVGFGLAITFVGIPLLVFTMVLWTYGARVERWRIATMLGVSMPSPYRRSPANSWSSRLRAFLTDVAVWRDLIYLLLLFPIGIFEFVIFSVALLSLWMVTLPAYNWSSAGGAEVWNGMVIDTLPESLVVGAIGALLLLLTPYLFVGTARAHAAFAQWLIGPRQADLVERVDELTTSRTRVVDAAMQERRRIERDLHDSVQQHLTALALDLGMAREKLESDPAAGQALVVRAHEAAKLTLVELRHLVRGIAPAILADRGLDAALSALAARSPVAVTIDVDLKGRLPDAVETTAYFIVAEALTNIARHSHATAARVSARVVDGQLLLDVSDNGRGGADASHGTGLSGLADRVAALDGRFLVESPPEGPTRVHAELPCGS